MSVTKHYICLLSLRFVTIFNDLKIKIFVQIKSWHLAVRWPKNNLKILIKIIKPFTSTGRCLVFVPDISRTVYTVPSVTDSVIMRRIRLFLGQCTYNCVCVLCVWVGVCVCVCVCVWVWVCGCVCVCVWVGVWVCVCVWIYFQLFPGKWLLV